jgi:hypothetical protein
MAAHIVCAECSTANRAGLLFCVVCGHRLSRDAYPQDRVTALAWPGPEVRAATASEPLCAPGWASVVGGLLAFSLLPLLGSAVAIWLGSAQLAVGLLTGAAMGAVAFLGTGRGG